MKLESLKGLMSYLGVLSVARSASTSPTTVASLNPMMHESSATWATASPCPLQALAMTMFGCFGCLSSTKFYQVSMIAQ